LGGAVELRFSGNNDELSGAAELRFSVQVAFSEEKWGVQAVSRFSVMSRCLHLTRMQVLGYRAYARCVQRARLCDESNIR
jgi:hypothetical protein